MTIRRNNSGFTLIEILVAVSIIIILAGITVAVGNGAIKNAKIKKTLALLKTVESIVEKYETDTGTKLVTNSTGVVGTTFPSSTAEPTDNYAAILNRYPATKEMMAKLGSSVSVSSTGYVTIRDAWGNPINFFPSGWGGATRMYLRSSGPDGQSDFTDSSKAVNNDDIFSYEP